MLKVIDLSKKYGHFSALNRVSLEAPDNSITGIIGPNGAGKSTLLRLIAGFDQPDEGAILFDQTPLTIENRQRRLIAYMPENLEFYPDYRVADLIRFIERMSRLKDERLLRRLQLHLVWNKPVRALSKGFKQRVKLYTALANQKPLVILDEPLDGFDPIQLQEILKIIQEEKAKQRTFLISIHQLSDAAKICDHYILLDEGRAVIAGSLESLRKQSGKGSWTLEQIFIRALQ